MAPALVDKTPKTIGISAAFGAGILFVFFWIMLYSCRCCHRCCNKGRHGHKQAWPSQGPSHGHIPLRPQGPGAAQMGAGPSLSGPPGVPRKTVPQGMAAQGPGRMQQMQGNAPPVKDLAEIREAMARAQDQGGVDGGPNLGGRVIGTVKESKVGAGLY